MLMWNVVEVEVLEQMKITKSCGLRSLAIEVMNPIEAKRRKALLMNSND